ncbi:hypothetical protein GCM10023172_41310 [Hymenobacter ginsengisoli]|uniref:Protein-glutamine gamma-glutamyltransferase-like C-terminal domain-containing protein n=1 Tax=Hymenobacter ginsengisoli TaxID=1051626 RepID=A0ABP8QSG1_9BACT|nr:MULTISPECIES: DUF4129 domain-containing protein [unclassified Hymenobacter]MBO2032225.1 DUF4129 domain-containing protein [Hymenobacter sp. BT559]
MRHLPLLLLLTLAASPVLAAPPQVPLVLRRLAQAPADTTMAPALPPAAAPAVVRRPAAAHLRELRGQREFDYREVVADEPAQASLWQRLLGWLLRSLAPLLDTKGGRIAWKGLFYGLMAAGLVFAVLKFLQVDITRAFGRTSRRVPLAYEAGQENIHELDFPAAIAEAEATGNHRLALRLGYLQLLKQFTDRDFIAWQPDKTNQAYLHELAASYPSARPAFAELTRQFEYSWYGELAVSPDLYQRVRADQRRLGQQLGAAAPGRPQPA